MINAQLCFIDEDKRESLEILDSLKIAKKQQKFKTEKEIEILKFRTFIEK